MAINFLTTTNTLPEIQINDTGNNPRLELQESGIVSGGISTTGGALVFEASSGIERARIDSVGRLLINTTTPFANAAITAVGISGTNIAGVFKSTDNQAWISVQDDDSGTYGALFGTDSDLGLDIILADKNANKRLVIDTSGKVGIGTSAPDTNLDVVGTDTMISIQDTANASGWAIFRTVASGSPLIGWNQNRDFNFGVYSQNTPSSGWVGNRMTIKGSGNVGIGTDSPGAKLDVKGPDSDNATIARFYSNTSSRGSFGIVNGSGVNPTVFIGTLGGSEELALGVNGVASGEVIRIDASENVGIGTTQPVYKLDVNGNNARIGGSTQTTTYLRVEATNTAGAPARAVGVLLKGYEGRGIGTYYQDTTYSGEEWYNGMPYSGGFNYYQIGYDASGGQPEYAANSMLRIYHTGKTILSTYGSGTHTGTAAKYLAVTSSGEIIETGSGGVLPGGPYLPLAGGTMTGNLRVNDSVNLLIGSSTDLLLSHNGSNSYISNYTGDLYIENAHDDGDIIFKSDNGSGGTTTYLDLDGNGGVMNAYVELRFGNGIKTKYGASQDLLIYHDGNGVIRNQTGDLYIDNYQDDGDIKFRADDGSGSNAEYFRLDGGITSLVASKDLLMAIDGNGGKIKFGASQDLQIYHDGSNSYIDETGTGDLIIKGGNDILFQDAVGNTLANMNQANSVELYYGNSKKFETTNTGIDVTGEILVTSGDFISWGTSGYSAIEGSTVSNNLKLRTNNTIALTLDSSQNATFAGTITTGSDLTIGGTGGIFIPENLYHVADTNTYIGFPTTDEWRVVTGGAQRLDVTNSGVRIGGGARVTTILDEDTMSSDSATALATQQSIKAYVDTSITGSTTYRGTWDPNVSLNSGYGNPNLNTVTKQDGYYYICSGNGVATPNGSGTEPDSWHTGDWVVYNSDLGSSGEWQKIDNTSVISGTGTGQKVVKWDGSGTSETLANGPITFSGNNSTFAGTLAVTGSTTLAGLSATSLTTPLIQLQGDLNVLNKAQTAYITLADRDTSGSEVVYNITNAGSATFAGDVTVTGGDITIGTDSIAGNINSVGDVLALNVDSNTGGGAGANIQLKTAGTAQLTVTSSSATFAGNVLVPSNNVGIGTMPSGGPQAALHVSGAFNTNAPTGNGVLMGLYNSTHGYIQLNGSSGSYIDFSTSGVDHKGRILYDNSSNYLRFDTNGTEKMRLTSAGNVGIGTANPENKLHILTSTSDTTQQLLIQNGSTGDAAIKFNISGDTYSFGIDNSDSDKFKLSAGNLGTNDRITVDSSGLVGIGTSSPTYKLSVSGGIEAGGKVTYSDSFGSLTTTGSAVAGLTAGFNGASAGFEFKCYGGAGKYQRIVYSCYCDGTTWRPKKVIDEGTNDLDVSASADGATITFTYKATSATQSYSPRILVEATGHSINSTYA
jgi:hypothetical protein